MFVRGTVSSRICLRKGSASPGPAEAEIAGRIGKDLPLEETSSRGLHIGGKRAETAP